VLRGRHRTVSLVVVLGAVVALVAVATAWRLRSDGATTEPSSAEPSGPTWPTRPADARDQRILPPVAVKQRSDTLNLVFEVNYKPYARWDPCRPIHVVVNDAMAPPVGEGLIRQALDRVSRASGLAFVLDGSTDEDFSLDRQLMQETYGDGWAPVLILWTNADSEPELRGRAVGFSRPEIQMRGQTASSMRIVSGQVALDAPDFQRIIVGPRGLALARAIIMHELGHVVGLDHVDDRGELMRELSHGQTTWGPGDRTGLAILGRGPCFDD